MGVSNIYIDLHLGSYYVQSLVVGGWDLPLTVIVQRMEKDLKEVVNLEVSCSYCYNVDSAVNLRMSTCSQLNEISTSGLSLVSNF